MIVEALIGVLAFAGVIIAGLAAALRVRQPHHANPGEAPTVNIPSLSTLRQRVDDVHGRLGSIEGKQGEILLELTGIHTLLEERLPHRAP